MDLLFLICKNNGRKIWLLTVLSIASGSMHVIFLILVNKTLSSLINKNSSNSLDMIYALVILILYLFTNRWLMGMTIKFSLRIIHEIRLSLMRSTLSKTHSEMVVEQNILFSAISKDTITLSYAALSITQLITLGVTITGCIIYLSFLSWKILLFIIVIASLGAVIYIIGAPKNIKHMENARESEDVLFYNAKQVINGFKEIKIDPQKGIDIVEGALLSSSSTSMESYCKGYSGFYNTSLIGQFLIYLALISLLFGGVYLKISPVLLMNSIIVVLYLIGPLESITALIPQLGEGNVAATRLIELLNKPQSEDTNHNFTICKDFKNIRYENLFYTYPSLIDEQGFTVGPINLTINKGEVIFIHGGNGAGKTTMLYLVLNLLKPNDGRFYIDNQLITISETPSNIFSVVFSDFYLFDSFYGNMEVDVVKATDYLRLFELDKKVTVTKNSFSSINLSTGQRKRLALISAILEKKSILILDEWAADQSPEFRRKFYIEIIPLLKSRGFTIIAITHDDQYYTIADKLYCMDYGQLKNK